MNGRIKRYLRATSIDYVHWDMDGNQMFRYPMDIQEMGCATWERLFFRLLLMTGYMQIAVCFCLINCKTHDFHMQT
jgi:hypothetical protein